MTEPLTEAEFYVEFIRHHFPRDIEGLTDPEEIGRHLVAIAAAEPRLWAGVNILRSLGVLVEANRVQ